MPRSYHRDAQLRLGVYRITRCEYYGWGDQNATIESTGTLFRDAAEWPAAHAER
jgi:hypothetical protein